MVDGRISALLELGAGFNGEYSGIENVYLNGQMIGFSKEEIDAKLQDILDFADIGEFIHQPVKTYSSGMFVRLAFAVAINIEPEILIVDEALSVGDVFFQAKCYRKFEEFKEMGKTILFVSHDLSSIGKYCDRVVLLNKGEKLAEGDAKEMVNLYRRVLVNQYDEPGENNDTKETQEKGTAVQEEKSMKEQLNLNPKVLEYGSKLAEIQDFAIREKSGMITNVIEKGEEFSVDMKIHFYETIQEPIFAFTIKDLKGTEITGTKEPDKFAKAGFHAVKSEFIDAPLIEELPIAVECRLKSYDPESCRMVGEIVNISVDERVLDENGKVDVAKAQPITFDPFNNTYVVLGKTVGRAFHDGMNLKK